ncbi:MAG: PH domain-containing protein, partial [Bacteroidota bacterium]
MRAAIRVFGAGGPFALLGRFRSAAVGPFRAYATDRQRAVVLRWRSRTVVVTPDEPEAFAEEVREAAGL